ncbi:tetratricopeptide repeat protein [Nocardiopsis tropica]|nr:tetratricopeptide repeat protein [Nocardiopsis tropica]
MEKPTGYCRFCDVESHHGETNCGECGATLDPEGRVRSVHDTTDDVLRVLRELAASPEVRNRLTGDVAGSALQIGVVQGDISVAGPDTHLARQVLDMLLAGAAAPPPSLASPASEPAGEEGGEVARLRRALEAGEDTESLRERVELLRDLGRSEEALQVCRTAAEAGNTQAMLVLAGMAADDSQAERWYRRAAEAGDASAMRQLGRLVEKAGRFQEAERWYRRSLNAGDTTALSRLGRLARRVGDVRKAEEWFRQGVEAGDTTALGSLGWLAKDAGRLEEAERWYRQAAEAGHTTAGKSLGDLLERVGRFQEAEQWRRQFE